MHYLIRTALFTCLLLCCSAAFAAPSRIVSANLCTDQLLLQLADKNQIRALTFLSKDPALSYFISKADGMDAIRGTLESILPLQPDLVLLGTDKMSDASANALESLGITVLRIGMPNTLKEVENQIRSIASAIGQESRGKSLISHMQAQLIQSKLALSRLGETPRILFLYNAGYAEGRAGLTQEMLDFIGIENTVKTMQDSSVSLEALINEPPDVIVNSAAISPALGNLLTMHPAMRQLSSHIFLSLPPQMTLCGNNIIAEVGKNIVSHVIKAQPQAVQTGLR